MNGNILVGSRIREARVGCGYNQKEASIVLGIPVSTLARYEQAVTDVTGEAVVRMAKAYGVTADWILGLSNFKTSEQGTGKCEGCVPILNAYMQMNDGSRGVLNEVADAFVYRDCDVRNNDVDQVGDGNNSLVMGDSASVVNCSGNATVNISNRNNGDDTGE